MDIKPGERVSIRLSEDEWWVRGINITWISLEDVEYNPGDRWMRPKGNHLDYIRSLSSIENKS